MQEFKRFCGFPQNYGQLVKEVEKALSTLNPMIRSLVSKRIAEDLYPDFKEKALYSRHDQELVVNIKGKFTNFNLLENRIYLSNSYKTLQIVRIFRNYFYLAVALLNKSKQSSDILKFHLFFGLPQSLLDSKDGLDSFFDFLERHHLIASRNEEVLVLSPQKYVGKGAGLSVHTSSNLAIYVFKHSLNNREKTRVFSKYTIQLFTFLISLFSNPGRFVLASEHLDHTLFAYPECAKRIATLNVTQTMLLYSPIIFELSIFQHTPRNMWWYSANNIPFEFKDGSNTSFDSSIYIQPSINGNYVWSSEQIDFISDVTGQKCEALGSILFYLMEPPSIHFVNHKLIITIFDVTPYSNANMSDFYTFDSCSRFLLEIIKVVNDIKKELGVEVLIQVKGKRQRSSNHDPRYFDLLESLARCSSIVLLSENVNLYNLIHESDVVVSIPFTSPAFVAKELDTPSCYFFGGNDFYLPDFRDGVPVFTTVSSLSEFFRKELEKHG